MPTNEKSIYHLLIKNQIEIYKEHDQKFVANTIIKQVCSLKTLHGLEPFVRYDVEHRRSTSIANVLEASKEDLGLG